MAIVEGYIKTNVIQKLSKMFFSGNLKINLSISEIYELSWDNQEMFLQATIQNSLFEKYPLRDDFCKLFFKKLIQHLEPYQEIHDGVFEFVCSIMKNKNVENKFYYRHYIMDDNLNNSISIKETNSMVVNGTTGLKIWEAAIMLSDWILCNKELFCNRKILELGSGVGFTGITVAKLCAPKSTTMTDCHNDVLKFLVENIGINFPGLQIRETAYGTYFNGEGHEIDVLKLDWNHVNNIDDNLNPDIIIGADIIYDPIILLPLCEVICTFFNKNPYLQVYIASIIRNKETFNQFLNILGKENFEVKQHFPSRCVYFNWDQDTERCILIIKKKLYHLFNL